MLGKYLTFNLEYVQELGSKTLGFKWPKNPNFGGKCIKKTVFSPYFDHLTPNVFDQNS